MKILRELHRIRGHSLLTGPLTSDSVIVDAGAHKGEFSHLLHKKCGARCILIEANPSLADKLNPPPGGTVIHAALAGTDGEGSFVFRNNQESGSIISRNGDDSPPTALIRTISLSTLRKQTELDRLDLLKLDVEGAEFSFFDETPDSVLRDIGQITVEFHDFIEDFEGRGLYEKSCKRLKALGFLCVNMAFRTHGDVLFLNLNKINISQKEALMLSVFGRWIHKL